MALQLYNSVKVELTEDKKIPLEIISRNNFHIPADETNLIYASIKRFYDEAGIGNLPPIRLTQDDKIPMTRGLGSSAACIVAGLIAANEISGLKLKKEDLAALAAKIEGHPDNCVPAIMGGVVVGAVTNGQLSFIKLYTGLFEQNNVSFAVCVPGFELSTELARKVLPEKYSRADAVFNVSHASLLTAALANGDLSKLSAAMADKIHQPYRSALVPNMTEIFEKANKLGAIGSFLSGAGPTIISLFTEHDFEKKMQSYLDTLPGGWQIFNLKLDYNGAVIE
jgi:homoserine kinase